MADLTTWIEEINDTFRYTKDTWDDVEHCTLTDAELIRQFDPGYGGAEGTAFTIWTKERVYFPTEYDGAEGVGWVNRHPGENPEPTPHI